MNETDGIKSWDKFDFGKLPEDCYTIAYIPECEKITKETGLEEKFGGSVPFFIEGDEYPEDMTFLCQFKDPRSTDNIMYQVFIEEDCVDYKIKKINFDKDTIKKQLIIKNDPELELKPFKVKSWTQIKELTTFDKLRKKFNFSAEIETILWDKYFDHELSPNQNIKVGGTPMSCQAVNYDEMNLLQISRMNILDFEWGDSGIANISTKLELEWDCC